jgi:hypothetical protein
MRPFVWRWTGSCSRRRIPVCVNLAGDGPDKALNPRAMWG